jgi:hypothetical protein
VIKSGQHRAVLIGTYFRCVENMGFFCVCLKKLKTNFIGKNVAGIFLQIL